MNEYKTRTSLWGAVYGVIAIYLISQGLIWLHISSWIPYLVMTFIVYLVVLLYAADIITIFSTTIYLENLLLGLRDLDVTDITKVEIFQSIIGDLFNYGTVKLYVTTGEIITFHFLKDPLSLKKIIDEAKYRILYPQWAGIRE